MMLLIMTKTRGARLHTRFRSSQHHCRRRRRRRRRQCTYAPALEWRAVRVLAASWTAWPFCSKRLSVTDEAVFWMLSSSASHTLSSAFNCSYLAHARTRTHTKHTKHTKHTTLSTQTRTRAPTHTRTHAHTPIHTHPHTHTVINSAATTHQFIHPSAHPSIHPSTHPPIHPTGRPSTRAVARRPKPAKAAPDNVQALRVVEGEVADLKEVQQQCFVDCNSNRSLYKRRSTNQRTPPPQQQRPTNPQRNASHTRAPDAHTHTHTHTVHRHVEWRRGCFHGHAGGARTEFCCATARRRRWMATRWRLNILRQWCCRKTVWIWWSSRCPPGVA